MDVLLIAALLVLPLSAVAVLVAVVLVIACRRPWPAVVCAVLAAALGVAWVVLTYRDAVRADENGGGGNVFSQVGWLVAAVLSAAVALKVQWTHLRRPPRRPDQVGQPMGQPVPPARAVPVAPESPTAGSAAALTLDGTQESTTVRPGSTPGRIERRR